MDTYFIIDSNLNMFNYVTIIMVVFSEHAWRQQMTRFAKNHPNLEISTRSYVVVLNKHWLLINKK